MKTFLSITLLILLISCSKNTKQKLSTDKNENTLANEPKQPIIRTSTRTSTLNRKKKQDSLRTLLLKSKPNQKLKSSPLLQELYIRGVVGKVDDKYRFNLPFDLHSMDCGAPDCYSTDITFMISTIDPATFPKEIKCRIKEYGCIPEEIIVDRTFKLVEQSSEYVNYYSSKGHSNLLILGNDKRKEFIYYFEDVKPGEIKAERVDEIFKAYNEEDANTIIPYRSTIMRTNEYERFLNK